MTPETAAIAADEREHAAIWRADRQGAAPRRSRACEEAWHRSGRSGTLRAAVFGANDGLVSNLSLVMGVAGATTDNHFIVLAGIAGLLAGAFSMAAGEYISMQSQRELFENQIAIEREEMRVMPDVEADELRPSTAARVCRSADAERIASHLMADPDMALDTKVREELGLDPTSSARRGAPPHRRSSPSRSAPFIPLVPFLWRPARPHSSARWSSRRRPVRDRRGGQPGYRPRHVLRRRAPGGHRRPAATVTYAVGTLIGASVALSVGKVGGDRRAGLELKASTPASGATRPGDTYAAHRHGYDKVLVGGARLDHLPPRRAWP